MTRIVVAGLAVSLLSLAVIAGLGIGSLAWGIGSVVTGATVVAVVLTITGRIHPISCPRCTAMMPALRWPTSLKQALWGGWTCPSCGCDMNRSGHDTDSSGHPMARETAARSAPRRRRLYRQSSSAGSTMGMRDARPNHAAASRVVNSRHPAPSSPPDDDIRAAQMVVAGASASSPMEVALEHKVSSSHRGRGRAGAHPAGHGSMVTRPSARQRSCARRRR